MILKYPNAAFYVIVDLDVNEIVMTLHRLIHRICTCNTIIITIERFHNTESTHDKYTIVILTAQKHLTSAEISTLFSSLKSKKGNKIYGKRKNG